MPQLAPIVTDRVAEVIIDGTLAAAGSGAAPAGNVFYYRLSTQVVAPTKAALSTIFQSTVVAALLAASNSRYTPRQLLIRFLEDASDPHTIIAAAGAGAIITDSFSSSTAVNVRLLSAFRGKTMRGFKFFAGVNEIDSTGDVLTGAGLARWQTVRNTLDDVLVDSLGNSWTPFIRSRSSEQIKVNPTTVRGVNVTSVVLNLRVGTMRSRQVASVV